MYNPDDPRHDPELQKEQLEADGYYDDVINDVDLDGKTAAYFHDHDFSLDPAWHRYDPGPYRPCEYCGVAEEAHP